MRSKYSRGLCCSSVQLARKSDLTFYAEGPTDFLVVIRGGDSDPADADPPAKALISWRFCASTLIILFASRSLAGNTVAERSSSIGSELACVVRLGLDLLQNFGYALLHGVFDIDDDPTGGTLKRVELTVEQGGREKMPLSITESLGEDFA